MGLRFTVLASGSAGNCSLVQSDIGAVLLDAGLAPRALVERLSIGGQPPEVVQGMLLTHTHGDHWNDALLTWLADRRLPLFCHPSHHTILARSAGFRLLRDGNLVRDVEAGVEMALPCGLRCWPVPVRHDGGATFGYRIEGPGDLFGGACVLGYASDLGTWDDALVDHFSHVDVLALEFNHDVALEKRSQRPAFLIERVLGDHGHLSNDQAAAFVRAILARAGRDRLRHVVQLHLSGDCNRPLLARRALKAVLDEVGNTAKTHTATQDTPLKPIILPAATAGRGRSARAAAALPAAQPLLPGLEA